MYGPEDERLIHLGLLAGKSEGRHSISTALSSVHRTTALHTDSMRTQAKHNYKAHFLHPPDTAAKSDIGEAQCDHFMVLRKYKAA